MLSVKFSEFDSQTDEQEELPEGGKFHLAWINLYLEVVIVIFLMKTALQN